MFPSHLHFLTQNSGSLSFDCCFPEGPIAMKKLSNAGAAISLALLVPNSRSAHIQYPLYHLVYHLSIYWLRIMDIDATSMCRSHKTIPDGSSPAHFSRASSWGSWRSLPCWDADSEVCTGLCHAQRWCLEGKPSGRSCRVWRVLAAMAVRMKQPSSPTSYFPDVQLTRVPTKYPVVSGVCPKSSHHLPAMDCNGLEPRCRRIFGG